MTTPPTLPLRELLERSLFESTRGKWDEALRYADEALSADPEHPIAHKRRSLALWHLGRRDEAVEALTRAAQLDPEFASAHYNLACFHALLARRDDMLASLRRAIELDDDYRSKARQDADFAAYADDEEFRALTFPEGDAVDDLTRVFEGDDLTAITDHLNRLGDDIPLTAIAWQEDEDGAILEGVLEMHGDRLPTPTLQHVYRALVTQVFGCPDETDAFDTLQRLLAERTDHDLDELIVECWRARYAELDPGHLGPIERSMLSALERLPGDVKAELVFEAIASHGPDAWEDHAGLCASALLDLPADDPRSITLVDAVDRHLHGTTYVDDDPKRRRRRVLVALPPTWPSVPDDPDDPWARERGILALGHPTLTLMTARQLSIQRDPAARALLDSHLHEVLDLALDEGLADDARLTALEVLDRVAEVDVLAKLLPALTTRAPKLLLALGKVLHGRSISFDAEPPARALVERYRRATDWGEAYDAVEALRWFVAPAATELLLEAARHDREPVRREAIRALGFHGADAAVELLAEQLVDGSGQCVAAAAEALARIGSVRAREILRDPARYQRVLERAKADPRWVAAALVHFDTPSITRDLFELFFETKETEPLAPLAAGMAAHPRETLLVDLVTTGLDTFRLQGRPGRHLVEIARAAVAAAPEGPSEAVVATLVDALSRADEDAIRALGERAARGTQNATERASDPELAERQRRAYARRLEDALAPLGETAAALPYSLLGVSPDAPAAT